MKDEVRYAVGSDSTVDKLMEHARAEGVKLARAVLLFYEPGAWTDKRRAEWLELTGSDQATTRALGDLARKVLANSACAPSRAVPGYWMNETSGVLRPAITAYLERDEMTPAEIAAMRAYLRQWIAGFFGAGAAALAARVDNLTSRPAIERWLDDALKIGIDPL